MLIDLAGGGPVGTRAQAGLQVHAVNSSASAAAARDAPDPRSYAVNLLEALLGKGDASLEAGELPQSVRWWWWWLR
jgi:hypothetical protein